MLSQWTRKAQKILNANLARAGETHIIKLTIPSCNNIHLYIKDESAHITGSLKHRLAASLFSYGIVNGDIEAGKTIIEASSGCTAVSEAYFAHELGLDYIAVVPAHTSHEKQAAIKQYGGQVELVQHGPDIVKRAKELTQQHQGYFVDQFENAHKAVNWRGDKTIIGTIFKQLQVEPYPMPHYFVCGAGTGVTSLTMGRYVRFNALDSKICVVDPENSVFFDYYKSGDHDLHIESSSVIEGIGRPRVEPSFKRKVIDLMLKVPDSASLGALHFLAQITGHKFGGSTGTNFYGALQLAHDMKQKDERGSIVMLACDGGERYLDTYYNPTWLQQQGYDIQPYIDHLTTFFHHGSWQMKPCEQAELYEHLNGKP